MRHLSVSFSSQQHHHLPNTLSDIVLGYWGSSIHNRVLLASVPQSPSLIDAIAVREHPIVREEHPVVREHLC